LLSESLRTVNTDQGVDTVGTLYCEGGICIDVEEKFRHPRTWLWRHRPEIAVLVFYRYNAYIRGVGNIFRYDSPDLELKAGAPDHHKHHHIHRFGALGTGEGIKSLEIIPPERVPTLRQVLQEAEHWYYDSLTKRE
jgi:hypothetical protein